MREFSRKKNYYFFKIELNFVNFINHFKSLTKVGTISCFLAITNCREARMLPHKKGKHENNIFIRSSDEAFETTI
jgi:hypothetical protein